MAETYDITYEGAPVGAARMEKLGLYYVFSCRCRLPDDGLYRIHVIAGENREDLGICIPLDGLFGMDKRLPLKRLGEGTLDFVLLPKDWKPQEVAVQQVAEAEETKEEEVPVPETEISVPEPEGETLPDEPEEGSFIPVSEEEPFEYLDKLEDAHMEIHDDTPGIVFLENMGE